MIYHISMEADDPRHVATVLAELWAGVAAPFPPTAIGSWIALAGDNRASAIEVFPRGTELREVEGDKDFVGVPGEQRRLGPTHIAIRTVLELDQVLEIGSREGWTAKYLRRGDVFGVVEMWIEGRQMIEVLTEEMEAEYVVAMSTENYLGFLKAHNISY
jgi:hypothetical protein